VLLVDSPHMANRSCFRASPCRTARGGSLDLWGYPPLPAHETLSLASLQHEKALLWTLFSSYVCKPFCSCTYCKFDLASRSDSISVPDYAPGPTRFTEDLEPLLRTVRPDVTVGETANRLPIAGDGPTESVQDRP